MGKQDKKRLWREEVMKEADTAGEPRDRKRVGGEGPERRGRTGLTEEKATQSLTGGRRVRRAGTEGKQGVE